jgi:nucleoside-diphosphate-sugar epimerase
VPEDVEKIKVDVEKILQSGMLSARALRDSAENQIINLAGAEFVTINQVIQDLEKLFDEVKVEHKPSRPENFRGARVSITKAKQLLEREPKTKFEEGLRLYVKHLVKEQSTAMKHHHLGQLTWESASKTSR